jgi:hypothetical protein
MARKGLGEGTSTHSQKASSTAAGRRRFEPRTGGKRVPIFAEERRSPVRRTWRVRFLLRRDGNAPPRSDQKPVGACPYLAILAHLRLWIAWVPFAILALVYLLGRKFFDAGIRGERSSLMDRLPCCSCPEHSAWSNCESCTNQQWPSLRDRFENRRSRSYCTRRTSSPKPRPTVAQKSYATLVLPRTGRRRRLPVPLWPSEIVPM